MADSEPTSPFLETARTFKPQPLNRLLSLPAELRIQIYRYMTLSPTSPDCPDWPGAYFACRQLHCEIRDELRPETAFDEITDVVSRCSHHSHGFAGNRAMGLSPAVAPSIVIPGAILSLGLLQQVILTINIRDFSRHIPGRYFVSPCDMLPHLYVLFLKRLHIKLSGGSGTFATITPWGDLKSTTRCLMDPFIQQGPGSVNCAKITFTLLALADVDRGREKSTTIENTFEGTNITYQLTIVQDKNDHQSERTYTSATRFKPSLSSLTEAA